MHYLQKKVGIIGGGQLALMMAESSLSSGQPVNLLSPHKDDPAVKAVGNWIQANSSDQKAVKQLCKTSDVITFESEFVEPQTLKLLKKLCDEGKVKVFPSPQVMEKLADRHHQKSLLVDLKVPTSDFSTVDSYLDFLELKKTRSLPLVLKARRNGYDGKGTYIAKSWSDKNIREFINSAKGGIIAEDFIPFKRELAISLARNEDGVTVFLPLVETFQKDYRCLWVKGPIKSHPAILGLKKKLRKLLEQTDYVGLISFELFDTGKDLIVNEIAPRVHNSAHYSQDALSLSQFDLHLRAITNAPLETPKLLAGGFAMYNLIGSGSKPPRLSYFKDTTLHWYAKTENREGRKMGHLNCLAPNSTKALKTLTLARKEQLL